jgi:hypothetical protein
VCLPTSCTVAVSAAAENVASSQLSKSGAAAEGQEVFTAFQTALHATAAVIAAVIAAPNLAAVCVLSICTVKQAR